MQWNSPWGRGFPGWHIECTAMSTKYLGDRFDIHTGGKEHIPIHHTNEIAQAYGAFGAKTANFWLHNEWLLIEKTKVSKSLGNIVLVSDFIQKGYNPLAFRYLALTSHYRQGLNFTWKALDASQNALDNLYEKIRELKNSNTKSKPSSLNTKDYKNKFIDYLDDDLNAPKALALMWKVIKDERLKTEDKRDLLLDFDKVFGFNLAQIKTLKIPQALLGLAKQREKYRKEGNWQKADEMRRKIKESGFLVDDTKEGPKLKKIS